MVGFTHRVVVPTHVLVRHLDGECVLLNLETEKYFGLDATGTRMWELLTHSPSIEAAFDKLAEEFEVEPHGHFHPGEHVRMNRRFLRVLKPGEFYELIPPYNDVHRVKTISTEPSISLHLLANDTGCVTRQKFDEATGRVDAFRSGWSNKPCLDQVADGD